MKKITGSVIIRLKDRIFNLYGGVNMAEFLKTNNSVLSEEKIEKMVKSVFDETYLLTTPVKIGAIIKYYGFKLFEADMPDNESGLIIVSKDNIDKYNAKKIIIVNSNHSNRRNRFTVAHELGHFIMHKNEEIFAHRETGENDCEEINANSFASALLMPKKAVNNLVKSIKEEFWGEVPEYYLISQVADTFNVSEAAAEVRLRKLKEIK